MLAIVEILLAYFEPVLAKGGDTEIKMRAAAATTKMQAGKQRSWI